jgi:hypothetical protein
VRRDIELDFLARTDQLNAERKGVVPFASRQVDRIRFLSLSFFKEWLLCETQVDLGSRRKGLACLLYGPRGMILLDGSSLPIHAIAKDYLQTLEAHDSGAAYLRFFCSMVRAAKGRFQIVERESPFSFKGGISDAEREDFLKRLEPINMNAETDGFLTATALSVYDSDLYRCRFQLDQTGNVVMSNDEGLCKDVPLRREEFSGPFRLWCEAENSSNEKRIPLPTPCAQAPRAASRGRDSG